MEDTLEENFFVTFSGMGESDEARRRPVLGFGPRPVSSDRANPRPGKRPLCSLPVTTPAVGSDCNNNGQIDKCLLGQVHRNDTYQSLSVASEWLDLHQSILLINIARPDSSSSMVRKWKRKISSAVVCFVSYPSTPTLLERPLPRQSGHVRN